MQEALEALLAAGPEAKAPPSDAVAATGEMGPARGYLAVCARSVDNVRTGWPPSDAVREAKTPGHDRIAELESLLRECNAVCLCGCPDSEHEADECGESCGNDDHECIRVPRAVLAYVERLRSAAPSPSDAVREAAEMLRLTLGMRNVKHACDDRACSNVALAALNLLAALRGGQKGEA